MEDVLYITWISAVDLSYRRGRSAAGAKGCVEEYPPAHWGKGLGRGLCPLGPSPEIFFVFLVENAIFLRILTRLFIKIIRQWEGF